MKIGGLEGKYLLPLCFAVADVQACPAMVALRRGQACQKTDAAAALFNKLQMKAL